MKKEKLLSELEEIKNSIINKSFNLDQTENSLLKIEESLNEAQKFDAPDKSNILKILLITFNLTNLSDITLILNLSSDILNIIEYAGDQILLNEFKLLTKSDNQFFKNMDSIDIRNNNYRLFHESQNFNDRSCIILSMTESGLFKPDKFHALCNIVFDIIKYIQTSDETIFRDLFEQTIIDMDNYTNENKIIDSELFLFKFDKIDDSFHTMELGILLEISESIKEQLKTIFNDRASIFRFSLSEYIVIPEKDYMLSYTVSDLNNPIEINFKYKGVVLPHRCTKISSENQSIYNIFENIYTSKKDNKKQRGSM